MKNRPVVFLMGPTAAGKTSLATQIFDAYDAELVSVDAAQVYRGMNIGTAKPTTEFLRRYPHHLIDILEPNQVYSAAGFRNHALSLIEEIQVRGKLPILVGGSMFYFSALENGLSDLPSADSEMREQIEQEIEHRGLQTLHAELQRIDARLAATISPADTQRIQRAIEISRLTQRPPSEVMAQSTTSPIPYPLVKICLFTADRRILHDQIERRFRRMIEQGLVDEVKSIVASIDRPDRHPSMRIVGYRQVYGYLKNEFTHDAMIEKGIAATRQLAKRQLTWLRQQNNLVWIDVTHPRAVDSVLEYLKNRLGACGQVI